MCRNKKTKTKKKQKKITRTCKWKMFHRVSKKIPNISMIITF